MNNMNNKINYKKSYITNKIDIEIKDQSKRSWKLEAKNTI